MSDLEKALDSYDEKPSTEAKLGIISNAAGYASLLERHIEKENTLVFKYAEKNLPQESMDKVNEDSERFEEKAIADGVVDKYISLLEEMTSKYSRQ